MFISVVTIDIGFVTIHLYAREQSSAAHMWKIVKHFRKIKQLSLGYKLRMRNALHTLDMSDFKVIVEAKKAIMLLKRDKKITPSISWQKKKTYTYPAQISNKCNNVWLNWVAHEFSVIRVLLGFFFLSLSFAPLILVTTTTRSIIDEYGAHAHINRNENP